jgi:adenylosuccinate synthase
VDTAELSAHPSEEVDSTELSAHPSEDHMSNEQRADRGQNYGTEDIYTVNVEAEALLSSSPSAIFREENGSIILSSVVQHAEDLGDHVKHLTDCVSDHVRQLEVQKMAVDGECEQRLR